MKKYFKLYFQLVQKEMEIAIDLKNNINNKELGETVFNQLFDLDGPRVVSKKPSKKSFFIGSKLFKPFSEINDSLETIKNILFLIRQFPFDDNKISKVFYLKYHVENYFNELYILKNRLISYLKILDRAYKKSENYSTIKKLFEPLYSFVHDMFDSYIKIRGIHVHKNRYSSDDFSHLVLIELLLLGNFDDAQKLFLKNYFKSEYKKIRKKWIMKIQDDIKGIDIILERYFKTIISGISIENVIVYPSNHNWV